MAPLCSDPRQIVISLNPARRQALLKLVDEITSYMVSQLETGENELGPVSTETPQDEKSEPTYPNEKAEPNAEAVKDGTLSSPKGNAKPSKEARRIQKAALKHIIDWKQELMSKLGEIVQVEDDAKIQGERRKRHEAMEKKKLDTPEEGENLINFGVTQVDKSEDVTSLQALYHSIPTRLTTIPSEDRREIVSCILLLLLSTGKYSAHTRALILYLASALEVPQAFIIREEIEIAKSLLESSKGDKNKQEAMSAEAEAAKRRQENKFNRFWKVGLASVAGATIIGVTGGLAAPLVAGALGGILGGVGLGGVASFLGIFWMNGALVGALFGAYGAKMTGEMMDQYAKEVEDFRFIPLKEERGKDPRNEKDQDQQDHRLRVTIGINGWLNEEDDVTKPWRVIKDDTEVFALRYEMEILMQLGTALKDLVESFAWKTLKVEIIKRTVLATLWAALWPIQILAAATSVDNPFSRGHNRSCKAGRILADALINKVQGERPVTLIGYSLGATAIHACLQSLAERHAFGLIDTVVIIGSPAPSNPAHWRTLRTVVSGKIFNVYSENDLVLGFVYRAHSLALGVAGLQPIKDVDGIENLDLSEKVSGHLRYPTLTGEILRQCGFIDVAATADIEKDELIIMKDTHAEGELFDFDEDAKEISVEGLEQREFQINRDLHGLNISPPGLASPSEPPKAAQPAVQGRDHDLEQPPLPRRPTASAQDTENPPLPRRPTASAQDAENPPLPPRRPQPEANPPIPRRPVGSNTQGSRMSEQRRPLTPDSNDTDDGEYRAITMVEYDSD